MMLVVANVLGIGAFLYPFLLGASGGGRAAAHAGDAPYVFTGLAALLMAVAVSDVRSGRLDSRQVALLGILAGVNAVLRLPGAFGGASLMFVLPIVCGAVFGARFAFLLGASSMAASAVITGGVGPWLPFQMWALGWIGAGGAVAAPLMRARPRWPAIGVLIAYGWLAGLVFGALTNLWFWPFMTGASELAWEPGIGLGPTIERYWRFYVATSLPWDATRALGNAVVIGALGLPVARLFVRFRERTSVTWNITAPAGVSMNA